MTNDGLIQVTVAFPSGEPSIDYLARVGVSDTLFADRVGNIFMKDDLARDLGGLRALIVPYDPDGVAYKAGEWVEDGAPVSSFYKMNGDVIARAAQKANDAYRM
jgi:hypothetical protein